MYSQDVLFRLFQCVILWSTVGKWKMSPLQLFLLCAVGLFAVEVSALCSIEQKENYSFLSLQDHLDLNQKYRNKYFGILKSLRKVFVFKMLVWIWIFIRNRSCVILDFSGLSYKLKTQSCFFGETLQITKSTQQQLQTLLNYFHIRTNQTITWRWYRESYQDGLIFENNYLMTKMLILKVNRVSQFDFL